MTAGRFPLAHFKFSAPYFNPPRALVFSAPYFNTPGALVLSAPCFENRSATTQQHSLNLKAAALGLNIYAA